MDTSPVLNPLSHDENSRASLFAMNENNGQAVGSFYSSHNDPWEEVLTVPFYFILFIFVFLGPLWWHMEVPRLRVKSELQQCQVWAVSSTYTTAHSNARSLTH